jgi:malonyl-CoA O-methyltransferase
LILSMLNKEQVKANFNKSAVSYDDNATTQQDSAKFLVKSLMDNIGNYKPKIILDIGTGTGFITEQLLKEFPNSQYILNDLSSNMLNVAVSKFNDYYDVTGLLGDAENCNLPNNDLTISNLTFQWFNHLEVTIDRLWQKTKVLAFANLTNGTFKEWYNYLNLPLHTYHTTSGMINICENLKPQALKFYSLTYPISFKNPAIFAKYLKNLGANTTRIPTHGISSLLKAETPVHTSYEVFYAILIKEKN